MKQPLSPYEKITFQEATSIMYYHFESKQQFVSLLEDMMLSVEPPYKHVAPLWYENYKQHLTDNKKSK
jgi:hypothetical protein